MDNVDIIDLFDEEVKKKEQKKLKKINKQKEKDKKKRDIYLKKLEKQEDVEFENYLKQLHSQNEEKPTKKEANEKIVKNIDVEKTTEHTEKHPFLNALLIIFSICLIVITADYVIYNSITNFKDIYTMINSIILALTILFYILSLLIKNIKVKKVFEILSIIVLILFMAYHLFII